MPKKLVVVESPTKAKTLERFLGGDYTVKASYGHIRDLPKNKLGVDTEREFEPEYVVPEDSKKVVAQLRSAHKKAADLILATDFDREGEAIAFHVASLLGVDPSEAKRVTFTEITRNAIVEAFEDPRTLDLKLVEAQQARRVLDRLVGYRLSPVLWKKVRTGLSAGRVQSVAVRLIVDREREIAAFVPVEYWSLHARLSAKLPPEFEATLREVAGEKASIANEAEAQALVARLDGQRFIVRSVTRGERRRNPAPPFITSTLQQDAGRKLGFSAKKTMTVAQQLYEGAELGDEGAVGLITYMRTDSVRIAQEAQAEARRWATERLGAEYLPDTPPVYKSRGSAQEAHEAIRPSDVARDPKSMARFLIKDQQALYRLIWERFLASQHFTQPPPRFTEASLIKALEELGIGRPSTYASILGTIINDRGYVHRERRTLFPTELGVAVTDKLLPFFGDIMNVEFTAQMEGELDKVEEGEMSWVDTIKDFYTPFKRDLARAKKEMGSE